MREVDRSSSAVTAQPGHRTMMALKHLSDSRLTVTHTHTHENDSQDRTSKQKSVLRK